MGADLLLGVKHFLVFVGDYGLDCQITHRKPLLPQWLFISSIIPKAPKTHSNSWHYHPPPTLVLSPFCRSFKSKISPQTAGYSGVSVLLEGSGKDWEWLGWWLAWRVL